jgi:hypothetical protein
VKCCWVVAAEPVPEFGAADELEKLRVVCFAAGEAAGAGVGWEVCVFALELLPFRLKSIAIASARIATPRPIIRIILSVPLCVDMAYGSGGSCGAVIVLLIGNGVGWETQAMSLGRN